MEVGRLLSKWWFVALASLALGSLLGLMAFEAVFHDVLRSGMIWDSSYRPLFIVTSVLPLFGFFASLIGLLLIMGPRYSVEGLGFAAPNLLMRKGYQVSAKMGSYDVRVAKFSVIRVYEGTHTFRCLPTSNAAWTIAILFLIPQAGLFAFILALYVHRGCWKNLDALTAEKGDAQPKEERGIEELVRDSLMSAYMLARGSADIRRSSFHDRALIVLTLAILSWAVLLAFSAPAIVGDGSLLGLLLGTLLIAAMAAIVFVILRTRSTKKVEHEEAWARRLLCAARGEDGPGSPIELLLDACQQVPGWLLVHRRGVWIREPGKTLLIFLLLMAGTNGIMSYGSIWWGFLIASVACLALGIYLFSIMTITAKFEARDLAREWERRIAEMGSLLEPEGRH